MRTTLNMRLVDKRLHPLERRRHIIHSAATLRQVDRLLSADDAEEIARYVAEAGDDALEMVIRHSLGLAADEPLTDDMLEAIAAGGEPE